MKKIDRTGEVINNLNGLEMRIIEYKNNKEVRVLFTASGETRKTTYLKFRQGKVYPTWRNRKFKGIDINQDVRDVDLSVIAEADDVNSNIAVALALAFGIIGITWGIVEIIKWIW